MLGETRNGTKAVMIIASKDFRDAEYFIPKEILERIWIKVQTASNEKGVAIGAEGGEMIIDSLVSKTKADDFDAIIFIGGPGVLKSLDNEESYKLIRQAVAKGKVLAAISSSSIILVKAGVLNGKKISVWTSHLDKKTADILKEKGTIIQEESVVVDGNIITASGPLAAYRFGEAIVKALTRG